MGNWSGGCAACLGEISPIGEAAASRSAESRTAGPVTRGSRRALLSLQVVPPVVDGILSRESNYTGLVIMSGKDYWLCIRVGSLVIELLLYSALLLCMRLMYTIMPDIMH